MNLECKVCGHKWNYKGNQYRAMCMNCRRKHNKITYIKTGLPSKCHQNAINCHQLPSIKDDIMQGSILSALNKADIDPTNHREMFKDAIPLILRDDKLKFAFAQACQDRKKSPEKVVRNAIEFWLKENEYI